MARRRGNLFDDVVNAPWWAGILVAVLGPLLSNLAMLFSSGNVILSGAAQGLQSVGRIWFGIFCFAALLSGLRRWIVGRKLDASGELADVRKLSWREFEEVIGEAFRRRGYAVVENSGVGLDGGVDLVVSKDGKKLFVQCKQWKVYKVGVKPVRELFGVVKAHGADGGFFITSGVYTNEAQSFGQQVGMQLIDGVGLERWLRDVQKQRRLERIEPALTAPSAMSQPPCPTCGTPMIKRTAKRGSNSGSQFWGCVHFPNCRGSREA